MGQALDTAVVRLRDTVCPQSTGWVLFAFGVTSVLSVLLVGTHIDHHLHKLVVASTLLFVISVLVMALLTGFSPLIYVAAAPRGGAAGFQPVVRTR